MIFIGVLLICFIIPFNAFAIEDESDYYMERGRIELNTNMLSVKDELSPAVRDVLTEMERKGIEPISVAYTTVELKEVTDEYGNTHFEPMTNSDKRNRASVTKGKFTLHLTLGKKPNSNIYTSATTGEWDNSWEFSASNKPAAGNDLITSTAPVNFQYKSSYIASRVTGIGTSIPANQIARVGLGYNSVVYSVLEFLNGAYAATSITLWMDSTGTPGDNNNLFIGSYCHTWSSLVPAFGLYPSGVTFSPTISSWSIPVEEFW